MCKECDIVIGTNVYIKYWSNFEQETLDIVDGDTVWLHIDIKHKAYSTSISTKPTKHHKHQANVVVQDMSPYSVFNSSIAFLFV